MGSKETEDSNASSDLMDDIDVDSIPQGNNNRSTGKDMGRTNCESQDSWQRPCQNFLREDRVKDEQDDDCTEFYFESDHLALKGNKDYTSMLRTIVMLETQHMKAIQDVDKILSVQKEALSDPIVFVEKLQRKEDLGIPPAQNIYELPKIDWAKYDVALPSVPTRPTTRTSSFRTPSASGDNSEFEQHVKRTDGKILVRGRVYDQSKPETFNQLWTAEEQRRLEELLVEYPPEEVEMKRWKKIAKALGNRTPKQVQSRVQKYFIKLQKAGLPVPGRIPRLENQMKRVAIPSKETIKQNAGKKSYSSIQRKQPLTANERNHYENWKQQFITKSSHRHQRNNRFLFRPSTFFPSQDPPVFMSENDDAFSAGTSISTPAEAEGLQDDDTSNDDDSNSQDVPAPIRILKKVKKIKEWDERGHTIEHNGFKCDTCEEEPIVGTRWHCEDCCEESVDFCSDCVVSQLDSPEPHCLMHNLRPIRRVGEQSIWDQDYRLYSFGNYNYLDPNFMPE